MAKILFFVFASLNAEITVVTKEKDAKDPREGHSPEYNRLMAHRLFTDEACRACLIDNYTLPDRPRAMTAWRALRSQPPLTRSTRRFVTLGKSFAPWHVLTRISLGVERAD